MERDGDVSTLQVALANDPNIEFVSRVPVRYLTVRKAAAQAGAGIAAVPPPASTMWNLQKINWEQARALPNFSNASSVKVAVLDTGIDEDHPDLQGRVAGYTFAHPDIPGASGIKDIVGHGTHVSGTIVANTNNNVGINGICDCQLFAWKIFDDLEDPNPKNLPQEFVYFVDTPMYHRALADCVSQGMDVVNLSIGGTREPDPNEQNLFNNLLANGTTVVAAMGNDRQAGNPISYPAAIRGVIAVGATNIDDSVANFSSKGITLRYRRLAFRSGRLCRHTPGR
jgi:subtilisin family serine protease